MPRVQWFNTVLQKYKGQGLQPNDPTNNISVGQDGIGLENTFEGHNWDPILVRTWGLERNGIWSRVLSHTPYTSSECPVLDRVMIWVGLPIWKKKVFLTVFIIIISYPSQYKSSFFYIIFCTHLFYLTNEWGVLFLKI